MFASKSSTACTASYDHVAGYLVTNTLCSFFNGNADLFFRPTTASNRYSVLLRSNFCHGEVLLEVVLKVVKKQCVLPREKSGTPQQHANWPGIESSRFLARQVSLHPGHLLRTCCPTCPPGHGAVLAPVSAGYIPAPASLQGELQRRAAAATQCGGGPRARACSRAARPPAPCRPPI